MIEQTIGALPVLPTPPSLDRINSFDDDGVVYAAAQKEFGEALNERATELNTAFEQVNEVSEEINDAKDATIIAKNEAEQARDEAVGAVAILPDGIINDGTVSATDTWSSKKISESVLTLAQIQATALYF